MQHSPSAFIPPKLAPATAKLLNILCTRENPWHFLCAENELSLTPDPFPMPFQPACVCTVIDGGKIYMVEIGSMDIIYIHPALRDVLPQTPLPDELRTALIEVLLTEVLTSLNKTMNTAFTVNQAVLSGTGQVSTENVSTVAQISLSLNTESGSVPIRINVPDIESFNALYTKLNELPMRGKDEPLPEICTDIPFGVSLEIGRLRLTQDEFAHLKINDVLLPEAFAMAGSPLLLRINSSKTLTASCTLDNGTLTINEFPLILQESDMNEDTQNELDITLSFELEHRQMQLKDISTLAPGYTFALTVDPMTPITILANGRQIGKGRIVDLNGTLGVQVIELK